jgi:hypothetical protein
MHAILSTESLVALLICSIYGTLSKLQYFSLLPNQLTPPPPLRVAASCTIVKLFPKHPLRKKDIAAVNPAAFRRRRRRRRRL